MSLACAKSSKIEGLIKEICLKSAQKQRQLSTVCHRMGKKCVGQGFKEDAQSTFGIYCSVLLTNLKESVGTCAYE